MPRLGEIINASRKHRPASSPLRIWLSSPASWLRSECLFTVSRAACGLALTLNDNRRHVSWRGRRHLAAAAGYQHATCRHGCESKASALPVDAKLAGPIEDIVGPLAKRPSGLQQTSLPSAKTLLTASGLVKDFSSSSNSFDRRPSALTDEHEISPPGLINLFTDAPR